MSVTTALERIERWARQNDPAFVALLQPGLSRQEIDAAVSGLPFALAEEVYELYQWRNGQGWGEFRLGLDKSNLDRFLPLSEAIHRWDTYLNESYADEVENMNPIAAAAGGWPPADPAILKAGGWLPVFGIDSDFQATLGTQAGVQTSPIAYVPREDHAGIFYQSLTALLEYNADVYESASLRTHERGGDFFDYTVVSALKRRHFPNEVTQAESEYAEKCHLDPDRTSGTPKYPTPEEFTQHDLVGKLARSGSLQAVPATKQYLEWQLGDAELAEQITQSLVNSPYTIMYEWPHERSLLVHNLSYSYTI